MAWFISASVNNGYPALNTWRESWQTDWTSDGSHRYPDYMWRCQQGVNNGYPWIYPWFREDTYDSGDLVIGGSQSNYPTGFSNSDLGGIREDFNDDVRIGTSNGGGSYANTVLMSALHEKAFVIDGAKLRELLAGLVDETTYGATSPERIQQMFGANVFDSIISCKVFPFDLNAISYVSTFGSHTSVISNTTAPIKVFGKWNATTPANLLDSSYGYYRFPAIHVKPLQAWEIESIDFSIYLPFAGVFPIDIRCECDVDIMLYVDLIGGVGEYYISINNQPVAIHRVMFGADVPVNTNQGRMQANFNSNVTANVLKGASLMAGIGGVMAGGGMGAMLGHGLVNGLSGLFPVEHFAMSTPAMGGLASAQCYGYPSILAKIPKMFKSGYGYKETLGWNRSTTYVHLKECSGYVKCKNYKTDIIVATDTEKEEIERLMNEGVFI